MNPIQDIFSRYSAQARAKRRKIFHESFEINAKTKILDLGSEDGSNIAHVLANTGVSAGNVYIADIDNKAIEAGATVYGFTPSLIAESGVLPFETGFFDIVYCSSVLEHVTVPKSDIWELKSGKEFRNAALRSQTLLANEIERIGKQYFVQTPIRSFPIESHSWLPGVGMMPRRVVVALFRLSNRFWVKKTIPDFYLLSVGEMQRLFPRARIVRERSLGFTKSIMAIRSNS
jgi:SAM-dependent methyltransferase